MLTKHGKPIRTSYYGTREFRAVLGIGKTKANELMHMFEERGLMYRVGRLMVVKAKVFEDWLEYECRIN